MVVDLTHQVTPQAIREGAFLLGIAHRPFPPGTTHLAVVDPGVGTARRALCLDVPAVGRFVGPDNGLFSAILDAYPNPTAREIANPAYLRQPVSRTFHGRDIFAPAAALLSGGAPIEAIGPQLDPTALVRLGGLRPRWEGGRVRGEVVHIDGFGNLMTTIAQDLFEGLTPAQLAQVTVRTPLASYRCKGIRTTYGEARPGKVIALFGSGGFLELARVNGRAEVDRRGRRVPLGLPVEVILAQE